MIASLAASAGWNEPMPGMTNQRRLPNISVPRKSTATSRIMLAK